MADNKKDIFNSGNNVYTKQSKSKMEYKDVINELIRLQNQEGLTRENILKVAKDKNNPLHNLIEWDDKKTAKKNKELKEKIKWE